MNIIDIQDQLKNFSEQQLVSEMQMPSGSAPQFLVLSEIQRRKRVRDDFNKRQAAQEQTVAQEAIAAAGVPQGGIAGMSEAMAPKSSMAQNGIGSVMPQSMKQAAPQMPAATDQAIPMAEGGLIEGLFSGTDRGKEISEKDYEIRKGKDGRDYIYKKGTNIMIGSADRLFDNKYDGGIVRAQQGKYFPSTAELYGLYGQESGYGKNLYGSSGEVGPLQVMPTTAIMPGYGIKSLFPELEDAIKRGDYEDAAAAYAANKAMVDEALMSGQQVEPFVIDYLDKAEDILGNRNLALLAYNQGIGGTEGFEGDPTETDYVSGVLGNQEGYEQKSAINNVTDILSELNPFRIGGVEASTLTSGTQSDKQPMPDIPQQIIRDETGRPIGDASYGPRIRAAMETGNVDIADQLVAQGVNEANFFEQMMKNKDPDDLGAAATGMGAIATPIGPGTLSPSDIAQVLPLDPTQKTASGDTVEESVKEAKPAESSKPSTEEQTGPTTNIQVGGDEGTYNVSSLEQEIKDMQAKLEKGRESDKWLAIAQAGLALMSSKEPTLLGAAGEAGIEGLKAFREANDRYQEGLVDLINARAKLRGKADTFGISQRIQRAKDLRTMANDARMNGQEGKARQLEAAADALLIGVTSTGASSAVNLADQ